MDKYISNTLIHWTGRNKSSDDAFEILKKVISNQIIYLSYCPNYATPLSSDVLSTRNGINDRKTMMVCFTDLPLEYSKDFCSKFGTFGIGFKKENMIKYGANPVLYTTNQHLDRMKEISGLIGNLLAKEVDREWRSEGEPYWFTTEQIYALNEVFGFTQEYMYKDRDNNYYQREWRINYDTLPFESGNGAVKVGYGGMRGIVGGKFMCEMKFSLDDIDYLIIPEKYISRKDEFNINIPILIYEEVVEGKSH